MKDAIKTKIICIFLLAVIATSCSNKGLERTANNIEPTNNVEILMDVAAVSNVNKIVQTIDSEIDQYTAESKKITEQPSEGGEVVYYSTNGQVVKIKANYATSDRQILQEFYFTNTKLVYLKETINYYDLNSLVNEGKYVSSVTELKSYYFEDEELRKVIGGENLNSAQLAVEQERINEDLDYLK